MVAAEHPFGGGEQAENHGGLFSIQARFDDEAAELDLAPGVAPAFGVSDALHSTLIAPDQRPGAP